MPKKGYKQTKEHIKKLSKIRKGCKRTEETKQKISKATSGKNHPMYGKKRTEEQKRNHSKKMIGRKQTKSHIRKRSISMKGKNKYKRTKETKQKISLALIKKYKNEIHPLKGYKQSEKHIRKHSNKNSSLWKGDKVGYGGIHVWLSRTYGKADKCENLDCLGKFKRYDWAKLRGKKYKRKRENFINLCKGCHCNYDRNPNFFIRLK